MADLIEHSPLNGPVDVVHPGDQIDCEPCRAALLAAFRPSPDQVTEEEIIQRLPPYRHGGQPHLTVPPEHTRTVDLGAHPVQYYVEPYPDRPGGLWSAACPCGWSKAGPYARDGAGQIVAQRLAETWAARHKSNPLEEGEDE